MKLKLKLNQVCVGSKCRRTPMNTANVPMHWSVKAKWKKMWEEEVWAQVLEHKKEFGKLPLNKPTIIIYLYSCKVMDTDNKWSSVKPILDGLRYANVIEDDKPEFIAYLDVQQIKVNHRSDERVEIEIKTI